MILGLYRYTLSPDQDRLYSYGSTTDRDAAFGALSIPVGPSSTSSQNRFSYPPVG